MSSSRSTLVLLALLTSLAATAHAQSGRTREQVKAELAEAMRTGNVMANAESGLTLREMYPQRYGAAPASTLSRAQVLQELADAQRSGDIIANGDSGLRLNQLNPQAYPPKPVVAGKTRAEVQAELREALRTGTVLAGGESGLMLRDVFPQRYANVRPMQDESMQAASPSDAQMR
jgi:hypothetical protein